MANLYELTMEALELQRMLENGEIDEQVYSDTVESLDIDTKISSICSVIRNLEADVVAFKAEKDRLAERQKTAENGIKRLKESLLNYMQITNQSKVKQGVFSVRVNKSESVNIIDPLIIPTDYLKFTEPQVNKVEIKKALKNGEVISGAELIENSSVVIR